MDCDRTRTTRRSGVLWTIIFACCFALLPAAASAAVPGAPQPVAPAAGMSIDDSASLDFHWTGSLLGAASEQSRAFFRVEIAERDDVPAGIDAPWPSIVNFALTTPGESATTAKLGAPSAGSYSWRVCAWGVANPASSEELASIGCSPAQTFAVRAADTRQMGSVGEVAMPGRTTVVTGATHTVSRQRTVRLPAPPAVNKVRTLPNTTSTARAHFDVEGLRRATHDSDHAAALIKAPDVPGLSLSTRNDSGWGSALGGLGNLGSGVVGALGWHLPGVPIPFWTLLLLFMPIPLAFWWKRSALGMFDMPVVGDLPADAFAVDADGDPMAASDAFKEFPAPADGAQDSTGTTLGSPDRVAA